MFPHLRKPFLTVCLAVSTLCLAAGYASAGKWVGAVIAILMGAAWLFARKYPDLGLPSICLAGSVGLAVVGRLNGAPPLLMICGSGFALAVWDLVLLDNALDGALPEAQTRLYESRHLQSLALALGFGLLMAFLGRLLTLRTPFVVVMLLVALVIFGLDRAYNYIKKRGMRIGGR
jgi:hypothetical protein